MRLDAKQCEVIMAQAFKGTDIPEYSVEEVNDVLCHADEKVQKVVELRLNEGWTYERIAWKIGHPEGSYAQQLYSKFLRNIVYYAQHKWLKEHPDSVTLDSSIECLELSVRSYNVLHRFNIKTVKELCNLTAKDIMKRRNAGRKSVAEIESNLSKYGFSLKQDETDEPVKLEDNLTVAITQEMIPTVYSKCMSRTKKYGDEEACKLCLYKGIGQGSCMFDKRPRTWVTQK